MEADMTAKSSYLAHLPAILSQGDEIGRFLLAFEAILTGGVPAPEGRPSPLPRSIEEALEGVEELLNADDTPEDFLPWLAQWVSRSLNEDWGVETTRTMISRAVSLYYKRGTKEGLQEVLDICMGTATIEEIEDDARPHYFEVTLVVAEQDPDLLAMKARLTCSIIDQEKPAHTYYALKIKYPGLRVSNDPTAEGGFGPGVVVGVTTVLGTITFSSQ